MCSHCPFREYRLRPLWPPLFHLGRPSSHRESSEALLALMLIVGLSFSVVSAVRFPDRSHTRLPTFVLCSRAFSLLASAAGLASLARWLAGSFLKTGRLPSTNGNSCTADEEGCLSISPSPRCISRALGMRGPRIQWRRIRAYVPSRNFLRTRSREIGYACPPRRRLCNLTEVRLSGPTGKFFFPPPPPFFLISRCSFAYYILQAVARNTTTRSH